MPIFRRRPPPRRRRFPLRRRPLASSPAARRALKKLRQAHTMMAQGNPADAATIFADLADAAVIRGIPRAPQLNLQAGRAWIEAGEVDKGLARVRDGLQRMATMGQFGRLPIVGRRVLDELLRRGLSQEATLVETDLQRLLATVGLSLADASGKSPVPRLPTKCNYCGGSVIPDEVDWLDDQLAACSYCGSPLEAKA
ncbi:MAG: hypothetical protein GTO14_04310 [Anaerolineales bacterium]|nr:hypothetical protein [Anaerolineales bacterium]